MLCLEGGEKKFRSRFAQRWIDDAGWRAVGQDMGKVLLETLKANVKVEDS